MKCRPNPIAAETQPWSACQTECATADSVSCSGSTRIAPSKKLPNSAAVPGSSFYRDAARGRTRLRFCFCKKDETLAAGAARLQRLPALLAARR